MLVKKRGDAGDPKLHRTTEKHVLLTTISLWRVPHVEGHLIQLMLRLDLHSSGLANYGIGSLKGINSFNLHNPL